MSPEAKKLLKITGISLLVLANFVALFFAIGMAVITYQLPSDPSYYCGCLTIGCECEKPDINWNMIILGSLYVVALLVSLIAALKRGHRAWLYNILVLMTGPLVFFLLALVENYVS